MDLDLTTRTERLLTRLGLWGAVRGPAALVASLVVTIALLESLTPPLGRLFPSVPTSLIQVFAVAAGVLFGLIGSFAGDFWDRDFFEACYGSHGWWLGADRGPLLVFPAGSALSRARTQAAQALARELDVEKRGIYREAVRVARRQAERWERIEHPLILSQFVRGLLWPLLSVALLASGAAAVCPFFGVEGLAWRFLAAGGGCFLFALLLLTLYSHLRVEHMVRLYQDVAGHSIKKKPPRR
jgi:hypothetical protein